jgi:DNA-binding beta-propeller fold protein YncE
MRKRFGCQTAVLLILTASAFCAEKHPDAVRAFSDPGVITTRQQITPAGMQSAFEGAVYGAVFDHDSSVVWVLTSNELLALDWRSNRVVHRIEVHGDPGLQGLRYDEERHRVLYTSATKSAARKRPKPFWKYRVQATDVQLLSTAGDSEKLVAANLGTEISGAIAVSGRIAAIPLIRDNQIAIVDLDGQLPVKKIATSIAPFGVVLSRDAKTAWVSNWGGRKAAPGERADLSGYSETADHVIVDARGVASSGTVIRIDLTAGEITHSLEVGLHPTAMVWDQAHDRLYIAITNQDAVSVVDTAHPSVVSKIDLQPFPTRVTGIAPTALALSPDGAKLYAACGGINAVAVIDTHSRKMQGMIPTAWYPDAIDVSPDGDHLAIATLLGHGSGWRGEPKRRYVHDNRGSVAVAPVPSLEQLAGYTTAVAENNRAALLQQRTLPRSPRPAPLPVPVRTGDPSQIEHVIYIIKENRTYDQVFGDLPQGNGDPSLEMFGEDIAPNHRRLASEFTLFDNFYATGRDSADGHQWVTQSNETSYVMLHGYLGRSYPAQGNDAIAYSSGGFLWDAALRMHKTVRVYGEFAGHMPETETERLALLDRWKKGADWTNYWNVTAPIGPLNRILAHNFPTAAGAIPDQIRADIFLHDLHEWEKTSQMPNLIYLDLPSDHTLGAYPGTSSVKAMVADNDLALGRIVEAVTHSSFWNKTAIMVVEDDAQDGVDHVDGHRTVALAISPYTRRGYVDSTFYSHTSMMKTIELMLGLPCLTLFDLIATEMRPAFQDKADLTPYTSVVPNQSLFDRNPPLKATTGPERKAAQASLKWRWDIPDAAPAEQLNRVIWHQVRGWNTPYPEAQRGAFSAASWVSADTWVKSGDDEEK